MAKFSLDDADTRFFEKKHVHDMKWHTSSDPPYIQWYCADACGHVVDKHEIERRLSATEKLSAEGAEILARIHPGMSDDLLAYAAALEGENEDN